jgi:hypothetical protein
MIWRYTQYEAYQGYGKQEDQSDWPFAFEGRNLAE